MLGFWAKFISMAVSKLDCFWFYNKGVEGIHLWIIIGLCGLLGPILVARFPLKTQFAEKQVKPEMIGIRNGQDCLVKKIFYPDTRWRNLSFDNQIHLHERTVLTIFRWIGLLPEWITSCHSLKIQDLLLKLKRNYFKKQCSSPSFLLT